MPSSICICVATEDALSDLSQIDHVESYGCFYIWHTDFSAYIDKAMVADPYCPYLSNYDI
jgi:hypothetical protein